MIFEIVSKYHDLSKLDKHHRFKSWEHCYRYFSTNYRNMHNEQTFDYACLHLAFYLASWGMLRGNAFLLDKDYRVHEYFLREVVMNPNYYRYYDLPSKNELNADYIKDINQLIIDTTDSYTKNILQINGKDEDIHVTDTLSSKILLGVYGNVPAYDRYFKDALKLHGINSQFHEGSLLELLHFYETYREDFEKCRYLFNKEGVDYTPMKLVDMYFWQTGVLMDETPESEEVSFIREFASEYLKQKERKTAVYRKTGKTGQTKEIRQFIAGELLLAKSEGKAIVDLKSGDIHRALKLENRIPSVCSAMVTLNNNYRYEVIQDTPSGKSSTRIVRYYL